jgi:vacuolar-type H+-ATPase subunit E/Vma4
MALSDLISRLEQEAQSRVLAVERQTGADVSAIEAETARAVAEIAAHHLDRERAERRVVEQRELALARREARGRELAARRAQLARILERARALVPEAASWPAYAAALPSHLDEALSFLEGLHPRVRCQAEAARQLEAALGRHADATLTVDESVGPGIVAETASVIVDNTLAARLARAEIDLAVELSRKLGEPPSPGDSAEH